MAENVFGDKASPPEEAAMESALGGSYGTLRVIREHIAANVGETSVEWKYYGKKIGWTMKTLLKKRNLFFIVI